MKTIGSRINSSIQPTRFRRILMAMALLSVLPLATFVHAQTTIPLSVPNYSFETPTSPGEPFDAGPFVDYWQQLPKPDYYTTNFTTFPWFDNIGIFTNDPLDGAFITNCDGVQGSFVANVPQNGLYQDYASFSSTQTVPSHAFTASFTPGRAFTLKVGVIGDSAEGLPQGATLQLSLYYRDASNNIVPVASTIVTNTTNVFPDNLGFVDYTVQTPTVQPTDAWANQQMGIGIFVAGGFDVIGGDWDVDNVRLSVSTNIIVPNFSFETPTSPGEPFDATESVDYWQQMPQPAYYTTNFTTFPWIFNKGVFTNDPLDGAFIDNCDGVQAGFLINLPQNGIFQELNSVSETQTNATHAFNLYYTPGSIYTLTAGIIGDAPQGTPEGATLQMSFYYRDAAGNMVTVASTTVTNSTNLFPNNTHFLDFTVQTPMVPGGAAWSGKNIGIAFIVTSDFTTYGGDWDVDNVRLSEVSVATHLSTLVIVNGQANFGLLGATNLAFNILSTTDITTPATNWIGVGTVTNTSGGVWFTDPSTNVNQRFYRAKQL
jgi:hypothetical protein